MRRVNRSLGRLMTRWTQSCIGSCCSHVWYEARLAGVVGRKYPFIRTSTDHRTKQKTACLWVPVFTYHLGETRSNPKPPTMVGTTSCLSHAPASGEGRNLFNTTTP